MNVHYLLLVFAFAAGHGFAFDRETMARLQDYIGADCPLEVLQVKTVLMGNNGFRIERWQVRTCDGVAQFEVRYRPPDGSSSNADPYTVRDVESIAPAAHSDGPCSPSMALGDHCRN